MSTIKSSSEDLTLNADGTGRDIKFQSNGVEKASISSAGAFTSTTIDATKLTGEKRNYIIDGDFTQWPEGTAATTVADTTYMSALWRSRESVDGTATSERSTDVPTVDASGHQSAYSLLLKCTGTDASIAAARNDRIEYLVTGSDFAHLHEQQVTISWWCKTSAQNSGHNYNMLLWNSAVDRAYTVSFSPTSTWTQFTHTLTLDTSGTWLFTEADIGLSIQFVLASGANYDDLTEETWGASSADMWSSSGTAISNFYDNTSNEFYLSQVGLYLGSTAPTFSSESVATVRDQVDWYVQRYDYNSVANERCAPAYAENTTVRGCLTYRNPLRATPTATISAAGTWTGFHTNGTASGVATGNGLANLGKHACHIYLTGTTGMTHREGCQVGRDSSDTTWIMLDSRH